MLWTGAARAEAPPREELRHDLLVTRRGWFNPVHERYGGIWRLDPQTLQYRRLRPFLSTNQTDGVIPYAFDGRDGFLTAHGDVLTYRTYPAHYDFDAYSWRMIRRLPTATEPAEVGWVVQGPTLSAEDAAALGLEPGTYGVGRCVLGILTSGLELGWRHCDLSPFPGQTEPTQVGDDAAVLWREPPPMDRATELFAALEPYDWGFGEVAQCLSFDPGRQGLWRCRPHGVLLYALEGGEVGSQVMELDLAFPPFDRDDVAVNRLFYLPARDRLFGTAWSFGDAEAYFFSVDPGSGGATLLGAWTGGLLDGAPDALAALGEPPSRHEQLLPIVAAGSGAHGTEWSSELWLYNPAPVPVQARLRRVTRPDQVREVTLPAHGSFVTADALVWVGGGPAGDGTPRDALVVTSDYRWGEQLVVMGRVSTPDPGSGGRYGHAVPAVPGRVGYSNHTQFTLMDPAVYHLGTPGGTSSHVDLDLRQPGRYRYNLGVVNDLDVAVSLRLVWGFGEGREIDLSPLRPPETVAEATVSAHGVELFSLEALFPPEVRERWAPRIAVLGDRPAVVWLSMVDNLTGDATFVPFTSFQYGNDAEEDRLVIPVVAHLPGANESRWQTDLFGYAYFSWGDDVAAVYHPARRESECGGATPEQGIEQSLLGEMGMSVAVWANTLRDLGVGLQDAGGFRTVIADVVHHFAPCAEEEASKGALEISSGSWFAGFSRTYTTRPDGGTYGSMLPLYPPGGWPAQHFAGLETGPEQRVNVGLYNALGGHAVTHRLLLYAADGALAAQRELLLEPYQLVQRPLEQLFGVAPGGLDPGLYGLSVIPLDDPAAGVEGRCWAFVSLVDNATNDPVNLW